MTARIPINVVSFSSRGVRGSVSAEAAILRDIRAVSRLTGPTCYGCGADAGENPGQPPLCADCVRPLDSYQDLSPYQRARLEWVDCA